MDPRGFSQHVPVGTNSTTLPPSSERCWPAAMMGCLWLSFTQAPSGYIVPDPHAMVDAAGPPRASAGKAAPGAGCGEEDRSVYTIIWIVLLAHTQSSHTPHPRAISIIQTERRPRARLKTPHVIIPLVVVSRNAGPRSCGRAQAPRGHHARAHAPTAPTRRHIGHEDILGRTSARNEPSVEVGALLVVNFVIADR